MHVISLHHSLYFFFNDTATTEIYTLSLHDALPISVALRWLPTAHYPPSRGQLSPALSELQPHYSTCQRPSVPSPLDRKSTRLNSSHANISYAVFCLKKKKQKTNNNTAHYLHLSTIP